MSKNRLLYCMVLSLFILHPVFPSAAAGEVADAALVSLLRNGGYTLYFRHTATDWSHSDHLTQTGDWLSCDKQKMRQLSERGRADARRIGLAIRQLDIPVGRVLASPYCRTVETGKLLDVGEVVPTADVMNLRAAEYVGGRMSIVENARRLLATPPAPGTNTVITAHGNVAREATPVYPGEGEGVVFQADLKGGFRVIARIPPKRWKRMVATKAQ